MYRKSCGPCLRQNAVESGICDRLRLRRVGRAVDGTGLENRHTLTGIGGSNPSLSAITFVIWYLHMVIPRLIPTVKRVHRMHREVNLTKRVKTDKGLRY